MPFRVRCLTLSTFGLLLASISLGEPTASRVDILQPPKLVTAAEWGSKPDPIDDERRHTAKFVTLHHAGVRWTTDRDPVAFIRNMQSWGKRRPQVEPPPRNTYWPDLPYHFLIAPDGRIFEGRALEYEPESNTKYDLKGHLGVELMGNFEEQRPSPAQVEAAVRLVAWLVAKYKLPLESIRTHQQVAPGQTACPGRDFARYFQPGHESFKQWVGQVLAGDSLEIDLGGPLEDGPTELITETKPPTN